MCKCGIIEQWMRISAIRKEFALFDSDETVITNCQTTVPGVQRDHCYLDQRKEEVNLKQWESLLSAVYGNWNLLDKMLNVSRCHRNQGQNIIFDQKKIFGAQGHEK